MGRTALRERTRRSVERSREKCGVVPADSLAEEIRKADGGNAELRGEVALPRRPRHGGK
jgi:hypothetical protein